jgi:hypothetical protein
MRGAGNQRSPAHVLVFPVRDGGEHCKLRLRLRLSLASA